MSIRKYNGHLGVFVYDDTMFSLADKEHGNLIYIGDETDGSKITIPFGIVDISKMFIHSDIRTPPAIPSSVRHMDYAFMNTPLEEMPCIPNSVLSMNYCFADNVSLIKRTVLPYGIKDCEGAFDNCPSDYTIVKRKAPTRPKHTAIFVMNNQYANLRRCYARYAEI